MLTSDEHADVFNDVLFADFSDGDGFSWGACVLHRQGCCLHWWGTASDEHARCMQAMRCQESWNCAAEAAVRWCGPTSRAGQS